MRQLDPGKDFGDFKARRAEFRKRAEEHKAVVTEAVDAFDPYDTDALYDLGSATMVLGDYKGANEIFDRIVAARPGNTQARWTRCFTAWALCRWATAWSDHIYGLPIEGRFARARFKQLEPEDVSAALTDPLAVPGRAKTPPRRIWDETTTVFVWGEQGLGDQILFARWLPLLKSLGCRVVFECDPKLVRLFKASKEPLADRIVGRKKHFDDPEPYDYQCALLDLPYLLGSVFGYAPPPPFQVDVEPAGEPEDAWGFVRCSNTDTHFNQPHRSADADECTAFTDNYWYVSFNPSDESNGCGQDILETAQQLKRFHGIVTIDSCMAHLGPTIGIETIVIPPLNHDARWGVEGDSAFYPDAKVVRALPGETSFTRLFEEAAKVCGDRGRVKEDCPASQS